MNHFHKLLGMLLAISLLGTSSGIVAFDTSVDINSGTATTEESTALEQVPDPGEDQEQTGTSEEQPAQVADISAVQQVDEPDIDVPPADADVTENPPTGPPTDQPVEIAPVETSDEAAPVETNDEEAPVETTDEVTPAETNDEEAPVETTDEAAPVETNDEEAPVVTNDEEAPVDIADEEAPAEIDIEEAPAETDSEDVSDDETSQSESRMSIQATNIPVVITVTDFAEPANIVPGALVIAHTSMGDVEYGRGTTDASGQLTLNLPEGEYVYFTITKAGFIQHSTANREIVANSPLTLSINEMVGGYLTINIYSWDEITGMDIPVSGATVQIKDGGTVVATGIESTSTPGTYVSSISLAYGTYELVMSHPNFEAIPQYESVDGDTTVNWFALQIQAGTATITLTDVDTSAPIAGATVNLERDGVVIATKTTDTNGIVSFPDLAGGGYYAYISAPGYQQNDEFFVIRGDLNLSYWLAPAVAGTVTINVTERGGTAPITGATVVIKNEAYEPIATLTTNASGTVSKTDLPFGRFYADISRDGYITERNVSIWNDGGDTVDVTLRKIVSGTVTVNVVNAETNATIANATIVVTGDNDATQTVTTNNSGVATFPATNGGYNLVVTANGYMTAWSSLTFTSDVTVEVRLESRVSGTATLHFIHGTDDTAMSGVNVTLTNEAGDIVHQQTTGSDGLVTTPSLPGGEYTLTAKKDGFGDHNDVLVIRGNVETDIYMFVREAGTFTVHVQDINTHVGISGAKVTIYQATNVWPYLVNVGGVSQIRYAGDFGPVAATGTTVNGAFVSPALDPGHYIVWIEADGYQFDSNQAFLLDTDISQGFSLKAGNPTPAPGGDYPVPGETPVATVTPAPGETPTATVIPQPGETPTATVTPEPSETPTATVTPAPGETPTETPDPANPTDPDNQDETGVLTLGYMLCADDDCENGDTQYDGYTVTWTVTPLQTAVTNDLDNGKLAAIGFIGQPVNFAAMQQTQGFTVTGVLQNGLAVGESRPIPIGTYNVCLNPVITGPNGETATIAADSVCSDVSVTSASNILLPFSGVAGSVRVGDPTDLTEDEATGEQPARPSNEELAQSVSHSSSAAAADGRDVTKLPATGAGPTGDSNSGLHLAALLLLGLITVATGIRRVTSRA